MAKFTNINTVITYDNLSKKELMVTVYPYVNKIYYIVCWFDKSPCYPSFKKRPFYTKYFEEALKFYNSI
uniref:Uncharacterized protein n=1 Tax=viral metagenome TaxID=1070528 RepID=A0A6H2A2A7_9ZZZZ